MPRNGSGTYSLPSGNPVSAGTLIDATWANNTLNDLANEMTDSLSRSGEGGMLAPFRITDGVQATPSLAFSNEPSSGLYRAGTNEWWAVVGGTQIQQFTATGTIARFAAGAVTTPSVTAYNDLNTGIYFPGADQVAITTGGVSRMTVDAAGLVTANSFASSGATLTGGSINNMAIGGTTAAAGAFTTLSASGAATLGGQLTVNNQIIRIVDTSATLQLFKDATPTKGARLSFNTAATDGASLAVFNGSSWLEGVTVDGSANVGIGTSSPGAKLSVDGSAIFNDSGADVDFRVEGDTDANLIFADASTDNVGIGTSTPATKLNLGGATDKTIRIDSSTSNGGYFGVFQNQTIVSANRNPSTGAFTDTAKAASFIVCNAAAANGFIQFATTASNNTEPTERLRIDSAGNLGIGTTSPNIAGYGANSRILTIQGVSGSYAINELASNSANSDGTYVGRLDFSSRGQAAGYENIASIASFLSGSTSTKFGSVLQFFTRADNAGSGSPVERMRLDASGNLVVGGTSAFSSAAGRGNISINGSSSAILALGAGGNRKAFFYTDGTNAFLNSDAILVFEAGGTERARITSGGDLLVGTTGLDGRFRVAVGGVNWARVTNHTNGGTQYFDSFRYNGTEIGQITGNNTATSYVTSSDRRLKENIVAADDAGTVVDSIQIVKHDWKVGGHTRYGVIAQDLYAVAPEAVSVGDDGEEINQAWGVDYSKLVPMLVKEIQSLRARVAALEGA